MPKGRKHRFTVKEDKQALRIAASERKRGISKKRALQIGYATVNKRRRKR